MFAGESSFVPGTGDLARHLASAAPAESIAHLYSSALDALTQLKLNILTGLCQSDALLHNLWLLISSLDDSDGLLTFLDCVAVDPKARGKGMQSLVLFCTCAAHLFT